MATATLRGVLSASVSRLDNLSSVKSEVWKFFEGERSKIHPREIIVINDGVVFRIENEDDYDQWSLATTKYVLTKSDQHKFVTITVFVED
jgi:hypothetical protein